MSFNIISLSIFFQDCHVDGFKCSQCSKVCRSKGGLSRHMNSVHHVISLTETKTLEKCTIKMLFVQAKTNILCSKCFSNEICEKIEQFKENINISENLLESINIAYNKLTTANDGEAFYSIFYSTVILKSSTYLSPLESPYSTLLAQKLPDTIFYHYKQPKEQSITKSSPINDKEIVALQYLAGYVVKKIKLKALNSKDYKLDLNQSRVKIMDHATVEGNYEHKLISALNRGGLTAVKLPFQNIFFITEEKLICHTTKPSFSKDKHQ